MSDEEYKRLMLLAMAEMLRMVEELVYPSPARGMGGRARELMVEIITTVEGDNG